MTQGGRREPLAQRGARGWWKIGALLGAVALWASLFFAGEGGWLDLQRQKERLSALEEEVARLEATNDSLRLVLERMESDPAFLEKVAREELGMVRPGEHLYRIEGLDQTTNDQTATDDADGE